MRLGRASTGPRRRHVHRSPRPRGCGAAGVPPRGSPRGACGGPIPRRRGCGARDGRSPAAPGGHGQPRVGHGGGRGRRGNARGPVRVRDSAVPHRRPDRGGRGSPIEVSLPGPAPSGDDDDPAVAPHDQSPHARAHGRSRVRGGRDAAPHPQHAGGRPRLPGPVEDLAGHVLRPSAISATAEADADGCRPGPLLPDRPVSPRRTHHRRTRARVHAARRGDVVHR